VRTNTQRMSSGQLRLASGQELNAFIGKTDPQHAGQRCSSDGTASRAGAGEYSGHSLTTVADAVLPMGARGEVPKDGTDALLVLARTVARYAAGSKGNLKAYLRGTVRRLAIFADAEGLSLTAPDRVFAAMERFGHLLRERQRAALNEWLADRGKGQPSLSARHESDRPVRRPSAVHPAPDSPSGVSWSSLHRGAFPGSPAVERGSLGAVPRPLC
jgi:hypothetical protein